MEFLSKNNRLIASFLDTSKLLLVPLLLTASLQGQAQPTSEKLAEPARPAAEYAQNFGMMYAAQWGFYLLSQHETIEKHGSFDNWLHYPAEPTFDKDSFDYNIFKHSLAGQYYYLFYRHQGYGELEAFAWTFFSSLAFEFTVETYTEKPSFQDIYQTPIYGTILGMGTERLSHHFLSQESKLAHFFGYLFNPFNLLNKNSTELSATPMFGKEAPGFLLSWRF